MLARMDALEAARESFAFESTLSGRTHLTRLGRMAADGYEVQIFFVWLPSPELAIARVATRARHGGHQVAPDVVRRRYARGLRDFVRLYRPLASAWRVYDGSGRRTETETVSLIARGEHQRVLEVRDASKWRTIARQLDVLEIREAPPMPYQPASRRGARTPTGDDLDRAMTLGFHRAVRLHRAFDVPLVMWIDDEVRYVDPWTVPLPGDREMERKSASRT
jgi:predicted ABC-type ATPase